MKQRKRIQCTLVLCLAMLAFTGGAATQADEGPVIGIDLGTTYSAVGIYKGERGGVEIIPNELGNRITPSWVAFTDSEKLVGEAAKNQGHINPERSINVVKRLIGRNFNDPEVQRDIKFLPYKVMQKQGKPFVQVEMPGQVDKQLSPEEVSAMILTKLKQTAENHLGQEVNRAVVTVPAYFNDAQRQATKDAGTIAGLDIMRVINEPTAAAIAYGLDRKKSKEMNVLVFDLGGGTFDVSLLTIDDGVFEVLATSGDTHLGGEDFDQKITEYLVQRFKKKNSVDIRTDPRAFQKLKSEVERAKRDLSSVQQVRIYIEGIIDGIDFDETLSRAKFEELCLEIFKKTLKPVENVLKDADMKKSEVDEIVLVGGSTRIPKIQNLLKEFFDGKEPNRGINPDEAVAYGAAVQAGLLSGAYTDEENPLLVVDVTPLSLGIETVGGVMTNIVQRGTIIPTKKSQTFTTHQDQQTSVDLHVFQGERAQTKDNQRLAKFNLDGIPPAQRGVPQVEVTFEVDANGILTVTAVEKGTGKQEAITIESDAGRLTAAEIERMVKEAEIFAEEDRIIKEKIDAKHALQNYIYSMRNTIQDKDKLADKLDSGDKATIDQALIEVDDWLNSNEDAEAEEFQDQMRDLQSICDPIIAQVYQGQGYQNDEDFEDF